MPPNNGPSHYNAVGKVRTVWRSIQTTVWIDDFNVVESIQSDSECVCVWDDSLLVTQKHARSAVNTVIHTQLAMC